MRNLRRLGLAALLAVLWPLAPCLAQETRPKAAAPTAAGVVVSQPWARATPGGAKVGAAFLELAAPAGGADKLVGARSPVAGVVELHTHSHVGGVMQMRRIESVPVPAGNKVTLKPGGLHIMLMQLKEPLVEGQTLDLTLVFEKAGEVAVKVPVLKVGSPGPAAPAGGAHGKH